ncbi:MAG: glutamine--fructose-6-phosphate transaminase (isomerizing) [Phycisphaerales bacterium JB063]
MCGIIGVVSSEPVAQKLADGVRRLEYRGYDSVGLATLHDGIISIRKGVGKVDEVDAKENFAQALGNTGIAHCRWGTHGGITLNNAHPHLSPNGSVAIVHNGIIENYLDLKQQLEAVGHTFVSETDTEVIAHLIELEHAQGGTLKDAVARAARKLVGSYALGVVCAQEPGTLVATRNESPLVVGFGNDEHLIASDVAAILTHTDTVIYLDNHEVAELSAAGCTIVDADGNAVTKEKHTIDWDIEAAEKGGYEHFMLKEIYEQPGKLADTVSPRLRDHEVVFEADTGITPDVLRGIDRVIFLACGTSWHSAMVGEFLFEELAKIPAEVEYASEFRYRNAPIPPGTLVIAISQSGETADTNAALEEAIRRGTRTLAICNVRGSSMTRLAHHTLYTHAGPEIGVASTKAFTTQLAGLYLLNIAMAQAKATLNQQQIDTMLQALRQVPLQIEQILDQNDHIQKIAKHFTSRSNAIYLGRGVHFPIALEGALKLKEISYIHAEGYPAAEMKHGPIALIDKQMPVVVIAPNDKLTYQKTLGNIEEVKARDGVVIAIATEGDEIIPNLADHTIFVPDSLYSIGPLLTVIPLQLLSYHVAELRGCDVDKPRNLSKVVTVE